MYARSRKKPLWKLVVDFTPVSNLNSDKGQLFLSLTWIDFPKEDFVKSTSFRYISDAITKEEALHMLKEQEAGKKAREQIVKELGYKTHHLYTAHINKRLHSFFL